jgi:hypothetical protein
VIDRPPPLILIPSPPFFLFPHLNPPQTLPVYISFKEQLPVWAVIGTRRDIKVHSSHNTGPGSHGSNRSHQLSSTAGGAQQAFVFGPSHSIGGGCGCLLLT